MEHEVPDAGECWKQAWASGSCHRIRPTPPLPALPLLCSVPPNPCVVWMSPSACTELEAGLALPEFPGVPGSWTQCAGSGIWLEGGGSEQVLLWEKEVHTSRPARWPRREQCCALCAAVGGRGHGPCGGPFLTTAEFPLSRLTSVLRHTGPRCPRQHRHCHPKGRLHGGQAQKGLAV